MANQSPAVPTPRRKSPDAVRLRSLVEQALAEKAAAGIMESAADSSWLIDAFRTGARVNVVGGAWLHASGDGLWPGIVTSVTHTNRNRTRTVLVYPKADGSWGVRTLPTGKVNQAQMWDEPRKAPQSPPLEAATSPQGDDRFES